MRVFYFTGAAVVTAALRIAADHMGALPRERLPVLVAQLMRAGLLEAALLAARRAPEELLPIVAALSGSSPSIPAALEAAGSAPSLALFWGIQLADCWDFCCMCFLSSGTAVCGACQAARFWSSNSSASETFLWSLLTYSCLRSFQSRTAHGLSDHNTYQKSRLHVKLDIYMQRCAHHPCSICEHVLCFLEAFPRWSLQLSGMYVFNAQGVHCLQAW
jgi:hypothetical protein